MIREFLNAIIAGAMIFMFGMVMEIPNLYRAMIPSLFGLEQVAPRVYSDAPKRTQELLRMITKAEQNSERFFGKISAQPTYIVCTKTPCEQIFGALPNGLTMGFHRVLFSPKGIDQLVFNHERIHVDLHALMGLNGLTLQRYPAWFDEGLSEFLAGPPRFGYRPQAAHKRAVLQANGFAQWNALVRDGQYNRHYGAARALVEDIVRKIGRAKLREIVLESKTREEFMSRLPQSALNP